jgi:hypothetical protein
MHDLWQNRQHVEGYQYLLEVEVEVFKKLILICQFSIDPTTVNCVQQQTIKQHHLSLLDIIFCIGELYYTLVPIDKPTVKIILSR